MIFRPPCHPEFFSAISKPRAMGDWSSLPDDLLEIIARKLIFFFHINRFASVCVQWRKVAWSINGMFPSAPPLLMLPCNDGTGTCNFFNPMDKVVHNIHLPEIHNCWICGATNGWLAMIDEEWQIHLFHPFSKAQIQLPQHPEISMNEDSSTESPLIWRAEYTSKIILSTSPTSTSDWVAVATVAPSRRLAFCRAGDSEWTDIQTQRSGELVQVREFVDMQFYQGRLYIASKHWPLVVVVDIGPELKVTEIKTPDHNADVGNKYLVECAGDLLYICRFEDMTYNKAPFYKTCKFNVNKLNPDKREWTIVESLGDCSLFVGGNRSFSISAHEFPGYRANCIYFTDHYYDGISASGLGCHLDSGVFSLEDGQIEPLSLNAFPIWPLPAFWYMQCP